MFETKRKLDTRVRWQRPNFRRQLQQARSYKRHARTIPQTPWGVFLSSIGLGGWLSRGLILLILILLIYLVYLPNFLFIQSVQISGAAGDDLASVKNTVEHFLNKKLPWPQNNLLLLSKSKLANYLLTNNKKVLGINSISKDFPDTLKLIITSRTDKFLLQTPQGTYNLANDGLVTSVAMPDASGTLPSGLTIIKLNGDDAVAVNQPALPVEEAKFLNVLLDQVPAITKSPIDHMELAGLQLPT